MLIELANLLSPIEAAEALGIDRTTVHRLMTRGRLRFERVAGLRVIPRSEVSRLLQMAKEAGKPTNHLFSGRPNKNGRSVMSPGQS